MAETISHRGPDGDGHFSNGAIGLAHRRLAVIDLTPAGVGPYIVPAVNLDLNIDSFNLNMATCGGQATIPIVAAVSRVAPVKYAEVVATIASHSAGPATRRNIDEFTRTTARGVEVVGGARKGKAIILLNPAEPPMIMRDTIFTLTDQVDEDKIRQSILDMIATVQTYVPGYRLKQEVQFERFGSNNPVKIPGYGEFAGLKTSVFLEVEGAGDYLPKYAGNLDIMTAAAKAGLLWMVVRQDVDYLAQLEAVDRFTNNMHAYPGRTMGQLYHQFFRVNDLADGHLLIGDHDIDLADVRVPVLSIAGESDVLAPADAVHHVGSLLPNAPQVRLETAPGGHLGVLAGRSARTSTWVWLDDFLTDAQSPAKRAGGRPPLRVVA